MNSFFVLLSAIILSCSENRVVNSSSASIEISTAHAVPLYKDIHSGCTADIFFGKQFQPRDIVNDPYFSFIKDLNFHSLQYPGGSTTDHDHAIIGDTLVSGGTGDGYNIREEDSKQRGEDINTILSGVGTVKFGKDFFNEYCALVRKLGVRGDLTANIQGGTLDETLWKIQRMNAQRVIFGTEENLGGNEYDFPDGNAYKKKVETWLKTVKEKYPDVKTCIDAAPVWGKGGQKFAQWNQQIADMQTDEFRLYLWDKDLAEWTDDQQKNLSEMDQAFSTTIPGWFEDAQKKFPGKKVAVWQWGIKNKSDILNTMTACIYIAKFYEFMITYNKQHDNYISYASFMSLKSLNRGDGKILNHYYALKACGMLFRGNKNVNDVAFNGMPGVSGVDCEENGKQSLLLINESGTTYKDVPVMVDQNRESGKSFSVTTLKASSLSSTDVSVKTDSSNSLSLEPYSVTVVEF